MKPIRQITPGLATLALGLLSTAPVPVQSGLDAFNPSLNCSVESLAVQPDGKIVVGGSFTMLGGTNRPFLGRIKADLSSPSVFIDISSMTVLDGGALQFSFLNPNATELSVQASEDIAAPVASWANLGAPVAVGGGVYQFTDAGAGSHTRALLSDGRAVGFIPALSPTTHEPSVRSPAFRRHRPAKGATTNAPRFMVPRRGQ